MPDLTVLTYPAVRGLALTKKAGLRGEYPEDIHAAICGKGILTCHIKVYILVIKGDKSESTPEFYYPFYIYNRKGRAYAVQDGPTHVSVRLVNGTMSDWIEAGSNSQWNAAVKSVVVKWDGMGRKELE